LFFNKIKNIESFGLNDSLTLNLVYNYIFDLFSGDKFKKYFLNSVSIDYFLNNYFKLIISLLIINNKFKNNSVYNVLILKEVLKLTHPELKN